VIPERIIFVSRGITVYAAQFPDLNISSHVRSLTLPDYNKIDTLHNGMIETGSEINTVKTEIRTSKIVHKISFLPGRKQQVSARQIRTVHWLRELTLSHRSC